MDSYALYRFPHQKQFMAVRGNASITKDLSELGTRSCFVAAPFAVSNDCRPVLIIPETTEIMEIEEATEIKTTDGGSPTPDKVHSHTPPTRTYLNNFSRFHAKLRTGEFIKIVLARTDSAECSEEPEQLFIHACNKYPRMFIALFSTPHTGTWLTATPEILLEKSGNRWHTIALAGTMRVGNIEWSAKNIEEQQLVAGYIRECIKSHTDTFNEEGPYAIRAGNLVHLRSDFTFALENDANIGELLSCLHPTPAVCGLPKEETYRFIKDNESVDRQYYSGFLGPVNIGSETRLYVTLRCMQIKGNNCTLYAGGGLLKDSEAENEWQETEAKMETMKNII